jgi:hypothetical protein
VVPEPDSGRRFCGQSVKPYRAYPPGPVKDLPAYFSDLRGLAGDDPQLVPDRGVGSQL